MTLVQLINTVLLVAIVVQLGILLDRPQLSKQDILEYTRAGVASVIAKELNGIFGGADNAAGP